MKTIIKIILFLFTKIFNSKYRNLIEPCIKTFYRRMVKEEFQIKTEAVKVKKGKRRYDIIFIETENNKYKINITDPFLLKRNKIVANLNEETLSKIPDYEIN